MRIPAREPQPGVGYTQVLRGPDALPVQGFLGLALGLFGYMLIVPLVNQLLLAVFYLARGRPGDFQDFFHAASTYHEPLGMVAGHVALACLIPMSMVAVRWWHKRPVSFLCSVQPGMRWRYLLLCLPVAILVLNAVLWSTGGAHLAESAPAGWQWWMVVILLFSPWQAAGEEFFFRGFLMQGMGSLVPQRWVVVFASALVFAIFHGTQNMWLFLDRFGFGLLAGALVVLTGGLEAAMAAHVVNNVFAFSYAALGEGGVAGARALHEISPIQMLFDWLSFGLIALLCWWLGRRLQVATTTPGRLPI